MTTTAPGTRATEGAAGAPSAWAGFRTGLWQKQIDVRDFIQQNYQPYDGDESFLARATPRTEKIWSQLQALFVDERAKGVLDVSPIPSSITAHAPGYIDRANEIIVGLQTDAPLKRAIMPNGGFRMVATALKAYGYEPDPHVVEAFTKYRKTHNDAVFDAYTADVRRCRSSHVLTGLPDAYGRGRIIGDYRRVALYGVNRLIAHKQEEKQSLDAMHSTAEVIRAHGAEPGYGSPVGVTDAVIVVDESARDARNLVAGANRVGWHTLNVNLGRDYEADHVADVASAEQGFRCPNCGTPMEATRAIEVGNIFKLGTRYSEALGANFLDEDGKSHPILMGSYGIGVGRNVACIVEAHHDEKGIVWPAEVAPYAAHLVSIGGAKNAGLIAVKILATSDDSLRDALADYAASLAALVEEKNERLKSTR